MMKRIYTIVSITLFVLLGINTKTTAQCGNIIVSPDFTISCTGSGPYTVEVTLNDITLISGNPSFYLEIGGVQSDNYWNSSNGTSYTFTWSTTFDTCPTGSDLNIDIYSSSNGNGSYCAESGPLLETLPVNWLDFSAKEDNGNILLEWSTTQEVNNDYFEVQRSSNGIDYFPIGIVSGSGTRLVESEYSYEDKDPQDRIVYYRLKQVDFDGRSEFSEVVSVSIKSDLDLKVYPNPVSTILNVEGKFDYWEILNYSGQSLKSGVSHEISFGQLNNGLYVLSVWKDGQAKIYRILH